MHALEQSLPKKIRDVKFCLDIAKNRRNMLAAFAVVCGVVGYWQLTRVQENKRAVMENAVALAAAGVAGLGARQAHTGVKKMQWKLFLLQGRRDRLARLNGKSRAS